MGQRAGAFLKNTRKTMISLVEFLLGQSPLLLASPPGIG
jgi:hypothetical protein